MIPPRGQPVTFRIPVDRSRYPEHVAKTMPDYQTMGGYFRHMEGDRPVVALMSGRLRLLDSLADILDWPRPPDAP